MIKRTLKLRIQALEFITINDKDFKKYVFLEEKWVEFKQIKIFFEIFKEVTIIMPGNVINEDNNTDEEDDKNNSNKEEN
ncbi:hypothetical protein C1645_839127 [Glomus cerebriforme]|uniref:Uncharacterized protein n=1 Tax=Glomus cerebriforme TaxID=658196 RepID=A0A397S653_9GLOM|nr:hypothetical protein C1645_839127 [Glomus cerebriforme]